MNQSIGAVRARDRADQSTTAYFDEPQSYHRRYRELDEILLRAANQMRPPTADELARMATEMDDAPAYTVTRTATGGWIYAASTAATSAT